MVCVSGPSPSLIHHGRLVEALLLQDFDGPLTIDGGQHGEGGGEVQRLQLQVPPPDEHSNVRRSFTTPQKRVNPAVKHTHTPWFLHHEVLLTQEALLEHPLVTQELGPKEGTKKKII